LCIFQILCDEKDVIITTKRACDQEWEFTFVVPGVAALAAFEFHAEAGSTNDT
jgi:hypothetical protein